MLLLTLLQLPLTNSLAPLAVYSWFWSWYDYVGGNELSTVPKDFFPQAKCALGAPAGPYKSGTKNTYTRKFAHASVFVDLRNRTHSKVTFDGCNF